MQEARDRDERNYEEGVAQVAAGSKTSLKRDSKREWQRDIAEM